MLNRTAARPIAKSLVAACSIAVLAAFGITGCSASPSGSGSGGASGEIGISLIVKTTTNPYFVAMEDAAKAAAAKDGVNLTLAAGKKDGDAATQIQAIEDSISRGDKGILITPTDETVEHGHREGPQGRPLRDRARHRADAGRRRRHHLRHRQLRRRRSHRQVDRRPARRQEGDHRPRRPVQQPGRLRRLQPRPGLPQGHGHRRCTTRRRTATRPRPASTPAAQGGDYEIAGSQASNGDRGRRPHRDGDPAVKNPNINVVYTINEPAAYGAYQALKAAGKEKDTLLVTDRRRMHRRQGSRRGHLRRNQPAVPVEDGRARNGGHRRRSPRPARSRRHRRTRLLQHRLAAGDRQDSLRREEHHQRRRRRRSAGASNTQIQDGGGGHCTAAPPPRTVNDTNREVQEIS